MCSFGRPGVSIAIQCVGSVPRTCPEDSGNQTQHEHLFSGYTSVNTKSQKKRTYRLKNQETRPQEKSRTASFTELSAFT